MYRFSSESFFGTMKVENPYGDSDGMMYPLARFSSKNLSSASYSFCDIGYTLQLKLAGASAVKSILWSHGREGGNLLASSSENRLACLLNCSGSLTSSLACSFAY